MIITENKHKDQETISSGVVFSVLCNVAHSAYSPRSFSSALTHLKNYTKKHAETELEKCRVIQSLRFFN